MSEHPTVVQCVATAMELVRSVGKTGHNDQQNYNFRGIDAVVNAAGPAFRTVGIVPVPRCTFMDRSTVEVGRNRTQMALVTVRVTYRFYGPAGDFIEAEDVPGEAMDSGDKAASKAMSVAYRIALLQTLCIPTNEPDPDEQSYERSDAPPPITAEQMTRLSHAFEAAGIDDKARRLEYVVDKIGHTVESPRELTEDEAASLIDEVEALVPAEPEQQEITA